MQDRALFSWELFYKAPIVGICRGISMDPFRDLVRAYTGAGLYTLEVTMNTPLAVDIIASLGKEYPNLNIGAGTVCNLKDLEMALDAGARFIVTPIVDEEVIRTAVSRGVTIFPGAYTPTEIYRAWSLGASAVKIFPATALGPQYLRDVLAPLNEIKLLPTGGITKANIGSFFDAGAMGVGMGGSLLNKELIANGDYDGLRNHFLEIRNEIAKYSI